MCRFMQNLTGPLDAKCVHTGVSANRWRSCDLFFIYFFTYIMSGHFNSHI